MIILSIFICYSGSIFAQDTSKNDSTSVVVHSPKKATYLALIPGAGQIYNKKYWKLPIVYSGFAVIGYFAITNRTEYLKYNDAYICKLNGNENKLVTNYDASQGAFVCDVNNKYCSDLSRRYTSEQLKSARDYYRRNMELSYIIMVAWYGLQILDATVDAHLYNWEVNDNLSVRVEPTIQQIPSQVQQIIPNSNLNLNGFRVTVNF